MLWKDEQRVSVGMLPNTKKRHIVIIWKLSKLALWLSCQQDDLVGHACHSESYLPVIH